MKKLATGLLLLAVVGVSAAGEPKTSAQIIAPYVDELTFVVVRADVSRLNAEAILQRFEQILGKVREREGAAKFVKAHAEFTEAGGKDVFVVLNLADGLNEFLVVVPLGAGAQKQALLEILKDVGDGKRVEKEGVILMGSPKALAAAQERQAKAIPDLAKAFAAVEASAAQVVVLPPRPFLRAQEELSPNLPKELGGGPITILTRGFQWAAVGVDLTPKLQVKAIAQAANAQAAEDLNKLVGTALNGLMVQADRDVTPFLQFLPMLKPKADGDRLVLALDDQAIQKVVTPSVAKVKQAAARQQSANNLKQIALAMHNYHDVYKSFPPPANLDKQEKPLLSWRVHILPFIEGDALYREFKLDEPWDSEHNKKLIPRMPKVYESPLSKNLAAGKTVYLAAAGSGMIFEGPKAMHIAKITDGTSNTIMTVEANDEHAVTWTKPDDYKPEDSKTEKKNPAATLIRKDTKGFHVGMADGSVRMITNTVDPDLLWALLTAYGGEVIDPQKLDNK